VAARFGCGVFDRAVQGAEVDVMVRRADRWESLGTGRTSRAGEPVTLSDGSVRREGGWVSLRIPTTQQLGPGLHRVRFVRRGEHAGAEMYLDVVPVGTRVVVTDIDGTLTEFETADLWHTLGLRRAPRANPGAAAMLTSLAQQGYRVLYLTGRPDWSTAATHTWLAAHGFPAGVLRARPNTTLGVFGPNTTRYKARELKALAGILERPVDLAFGNTRTDVAAYQRAGIAPARRFFFRYRGETQGGQRHDDNRTQATHHGVLTR
jgi:phosphatidate phosphatase PAH1